MLSAAKHPRALSFRPPGVDASAARILPLTVVDNSDFPPPRLTDPSDSPYDQETVPATPFKQRGFVCRSYVFVLARVHAPLSGTSLVS